MTAIFNENMDGRFIITSGKLNAQAGQEHVDVI